MMSKQIQAIIGVMLFLLAVYGYKVIILAAVIIKEIVKSLVVGIGLLPIKIFIGIIDLIRDIRKELKDVLEELR